MKAIKNTNTLIVEINLVVCNSNVHHFIKIIENVALENILNPYASTIN